MPTSEVVQEEPLEPLSYKTWILKVSIHCEGCKRKVKKILTNIQGVYSADIETKQQKVIVTGNIDAATLINKLIKSGKHAKLWPENPNQKEKKSDKPDNKDKQIRQNGPQPNKESGHGSSTVNVNKEIKPPVVVKTAGGGASPAKTGGDFKAVEAPVKISGRHEAKDWNSEGKVPETGSVREIPIKVSGGQGVKESKSEGKLPETNSASNQSPAAPVEKKKEGGESDNVAEKSDTVGSGGGNGSGHGDKKKKNKGQTGNKTDGEPQSVAPPASTGSPHHNVGPHPVSVTANQSVPHHHGPPRYYTPPPPNGVISYNMAHPSSSYTASYYASPPPNSYAYSYSVSGSGSSMESSYAFSYPGSSIEPQPTDFDSYPRQPLDSFEMFSDENPNGCHIS